MEERDFDEDHRQRLRDFFNYTKDFAREGGYAEIFERTLAREPRALKLWAGRC